MSFVKGLKCRECGKDYPKEALHVCSFCFGPLEVDYEYDEIKKVLSREKIESRQNLCGDTRNCCHLMASPL